MIQIFIENDDAAHDLFATVTDFKTNPPSIATNSLGNPFSNQRINRGDQPAANVQQDGDGNCDVSVHTVSVDDATVQKDFDHQVRQANQVIQVDVF